MHFRSILQSSFALLLLALLATGAQAQCNHDPNVQVGGIWECQDHKSLYGGGYPYSEDFVHNVDVYYAGGAVALTQGCQYRDYVNVRITQASNLAIRSVVVVNAPTSAPAGSRFQLRYRIDTISTDGSGNKYVSATTLRGDYTRTLTGVYPQTETINAVDPNLPAGEYNVKLESVLWDGSFTQQLRIDYAFTTINGFPASSYPAGTTATAAAQTVNGTWAPVTSTLSFTTGVAARLFLYGYVNVTSGTPGQKLSFGFSLDGANSVRTIDVGVPSYFPQGVNLFDHVRQQGVYVDVPAGSHSVVLWGVNRDGGSTVLENRQVEYIVIPSRTDTPMVDADGAGPTLISMAGDTAQPKEPSVLLDGTTSGPICGRWTQLAQVTYPANSSVQNILGEVYIEIPAPTDSEIVNGTAPDPGSVPEYEIAVESRYGDPNNPAAAAEFGAVAFSVPTENRTVSGITRRVAKRTQYAMAYSPLWWGTGLQNTLYLWVRKITCGASSGEINVGKRYISATAQPSDGVTTCSYD
ncbi:MAG TPA: hypothetical protein VFE33_09355 [Thermoanaerobaculia bacterium]|nr:hypothetical protein [Thermoanaerobaculia bacterium]